MELLDSVWDTLFPEILANVRLFSKKLSWTGRDLDSAPQNYLNSHIWKPRKGGVDLNTHFLWFDTLHLKMI